jgi:hypothetical protein
MQSITIISKAKVFKTFLSGMEKNLLRLKAMRSKTYKYFTIYLLIVHQMNDKQSLFSRIAGHPATRCRQGGDCKNNAETLLVLF